MAINMCGKDCSCDKPVPEQFIIPSKTTPIKDVTGDRVTSRGINRVWLLQRFQEMTARRIKLNG
jgi:hypothetical protein